MKLFEVQFLLEMGAKKACSVCGHSMANFHFYRNGGWYCKTTSLSAPAPGADLAACKAALAAGKAPRVSGNASTPTASTPAPVSSSTGTSAPAPTRTVPQATPTPSPAAAPAAPTTPKFAQGSIQEKIDAWLNHQEIRNYTINKDNSVDVNGDVHFSNLRYKKLPIVFNKIDGDVSINGGLLETLDGLPSKLSGELSLSELTLKSWSGCPTSVHTLSVHDCKIPSDLPQFQSIAGSVHFHEIKGMTSLKGLPEVIGGLSLQYCQISSIEGVPKQINGAFILTDPYTTLKSLTTLEPLKDTIITGIVNITLRNNGGTPTVLPPTFHTTKTVSLEGVFSGSIAFPSEVDGDLMLEAPYGSNAQELEVSSWPTRVNGDLVISATMLNKIQKVSKVIREVNGRIHITGTSVQKPGSTYDAPGEIVVGPLLGLTQIKGVKDIDLNGKAHGKVTQFIETTLNRVVSGDIDTFEAQEILIDAGFSKQARL